MMINKREVRMQFWPVLLLVNLLLYPVIITAHILPTHTTYLNNNNGPTSTAYLASSSFPSPSPTATAYVNLVPITATASYPTSLHHATYIATPLPSTKASPDSSGASASDDTYVATTDTKTIFPISTLNTSSSSLSAAAYDLVQEVAGIPRDASPFPLLYDDHAARPAVDLQHRQPLHVVNGSAEVSFDSMDNNLPVNNTSDITHSETESVRTGSNVEPTFAEPDRLVTPELDRMNILRRLALSSQERPRVVRVYGPVQGVTIAFSSSWSWNTQKNPRLTDPITEEWYAAIENMERKYMAFDASRYRQEAATAEAEQTIRRADHIIDVGRKQSLELAAKLQYVDGITKIAERAYTSQVLTLAYARKYAFVRVMGAFMFKRHRDMTNPYSTAMTIYQRPLYPPLPPLLLWFCKATTWNVKAGKWLRQVALVLQKVAWMLRAVLQQASLDIRQAWLALQDAVAILLCWLAFIYVVLGNSAFSSATAEINNLPGSYDRHLQVSGLGDVGSELAMGPVNERNNEQTNGANDAANENERTNGDDDEQRGRQAFNLGSRSTQWPTEDSRIIQRILLKNGRYHQRARSWSPIRAAGSSIRDRNRIIGVERFAMPSPVASVPVVSVSLVEQAAEPVTPASRSDLTTTELPPDPKRTCSPWSPNDNDADGTKATGHELARPDGPTQAITLGSVPSTRGASRSEVTEVDVVPAVCLTAPVKAEVQSNVAPPSVSSVSEAREQALLARPDIETRDIAQFSTPSNVPAKTGMSSSVEISSNVREMMAPPQSIVAYNKLAARVEDAVDDECPVQGAHIIVSTPVQNKVKRGTTTPVKPPSEAAFQSAVEIARVFSQGSLPPSAVQVCDTALLSSTSALPDATNAAVDACVVDVVTALVQVPLDSIEVINVDAAPAVVPPVRKFRGLPKKVQRKLTVRSLQHEEAIPAPVGNGTFQDLDLPNVENVAPGPGCFETAPAQTDVSAAINSAPRLSSDEPVRKLWMPEAKRPYQQPHLERPSPNPLVDSARQNLAPSEVQGQIVGPARPEGPAQDLASVTPDIGQPLPSNVLEIPSGILLPIGVNTMMSVPPEVQEPMPMYEDAQEPMPMYMDVQEPMSSSTQMNAQERMGSPTQVDAQAPMDSPFEMDVQEPVSSPTQMDAQERMGSPTQMDAQEPMGSPIDMDVQATPVTNATPMPSRSFRPETSYKSSRISWSRR